MLGSLASASPQADEHDVSLSNVKLNEACDATSAEFNADVFKPEASKAARYISVAAGFYMCFGASGRG